MRTDGKSPVFSLGKGAPGKQRAKADRTGAASLSRKIKNRKLRGRDDTNTPDRGSVYINLLMLRLQMLNAERSKNYANNKTKPKIYY